jgi:hypothetical protein
MKRILIQFTLLFICTYINAQQAFRNNGTLQVHSGASITGFGDFTNASSATLINNGNVYLKGNITNAQASMSPGTGTLYLNGSAAQTVSGSQQFNTYNLVTNNSAGITINNDLSVSGAHTFTNGMITTSATPNYMRYEAGSSYTGDADSRHVNGWVKKSGSTDFVFPVGDATYERTIALNSLSGISEFNAKYFINTPNSYQYVTPVWDVNESEYWQISKISGGTASVTMNWDFSKVYFPNWIVPDIVTTSYNGSAWASNGGTASGNAATTGTITSNSVSSFTLFTLGSRSYILPITLISFTAYRQDNYTQIAWTTAKEYNLEKYNVERSDDGISFYPLTQLSPRNSGNTEQYNSRDYASIQRIAYYRLRLKDNNGRETLSRIVAITANSGSQLTLLTNPVHDRITLIAGSTLDGLFSYTIAAANGQLIQQGKLQIQNGGSYQLELKGTLSAGIYTLNVNNERESFRYKLIVQ